MPNHNKPAAGFNANPDNINKNGRPKREWTWAGLIEDQMEKLGPDKKAVKEAVAASLIAKALEGDVTAIKEVGNRIDGLPPQSIDLTSKGEQVFSGADYIGEHNNKTNS